jgi:chemotaxis protein methyltransferase CheR
MMRWMEPRGDEWKISPSLLGMIDFRVDNLCAPKAPKGDFDIILCRNVLLYFDAERKQELFSLFAKHSLAGSWLLLGAGETTIGLTTLFAASQKYRGVYERTEPA